MTDRSTVTALRHDDANDDDARWSGDAPNDETGADEQRGIDSQDAQDRFGLGLVSDLLNWRANAPTILIGLGYVALAFAVLGLATFVLSRQWATETQVTARLSAQQTQIEAVVDNRIEAASTQLTQRIDALAIEISDLDARMAGAVVWRQSAGERIGFLESDLQGVRSEYATLFEDIRTDMSTAHAAFTEANGISDDRIAKLEATQSADNRLPGPLASSASTLMNPTTEFPSLPFRPLSIDRWGASPQLAVQSARGIRFVTVGDNVDGWTVESIASDNAVITRPHGGELTLRVVDGKIHATPDELPTLTVDASPADARIRVMNIKPIYHPGMILRPGAYDIEVTRDGFAPERRWIRLGDEARTLRISLKRLSIADEAY